MANDKQSAIIVGAGIFGVTAALALCQRGFDVVVVDPGPLPHPDASSTDISKAIRMDYGADAFYMEMMEEAFLGWEAWNERWGTPLYQEDGFLFATREPMARGEYEYESYQLLRQRGHFPDRLSRTTLATRFPAWNPAGYADGYFNPRAGWAASGEVVARLIRDAQSLGVDFREKIRFRRLVESGSKVTGIEDTAGNCYDADNVVIAAGAWTPLLFARLGAVMWPVAQPVLHFRVKELYKYQPPNFVPWAADVSHSGWYGFPAKADGTLKVANHGVGYRIHPNGPRSIPPHEEKRARKFFAETFPDLVDVPLIASRFCYYCDTWDGDFWIDHDPDREGLVVATGGSGHAFKFAPLLGDLIADVIAGKPNPYADRFAWRERGVTKTEAARFVGKD
jgi:glycine/D-amino acid oxidase-like deaminating enzyme